MQEFDGSVVTLIEDANNSAAGLVNLLAEKFNCFRDEGRFENKKVRFLKRAQIFVADLWAAFDGEGYGEFFQAINAELASVGAKVINNSWGGLYWNDPALTVELANAWKDFVVNRGGIVVFAAPPAALRLWALDLVSRLPA